MTLQSTKTEIFEDGALSEAAVRKISAAKKEPAWLLQQRLAAFEAFEELPMPQLSYGLHVNSPVNIALNELRPVENIINHKSCSEGNAIVEDLSVAAIKYEDVLRPLITSNDFRNKLEALHSAFWNSGIFVYAPKMKSRGTAEHVNLHLQQRQTEIVAIVVVAEQNANIVVTESLTTTAAVEGNAYRIECINVKAAANATVKFATLQKLGSNANSTILRKALAEKDAAIDWVDISTGEGSMKQETITALNGEGANSTITGAFFGEGSQQLDILAKEVHNARNTKSNIRIKGALQGKAKAIVQSFTKIMKTAANSEGRQKANVLLLSDTARASPIPKLEIDNYDVKASHEAAVGQLDAEKLFYLMSRGLTSREAATLAVEGFFEPLLRELPVAELADEMRETVHNKLKADEEGLAR
ncbi:SufD family Fe-S cluster assembly protein [Candidatus Woesearchaeota archaeon]|nr:SufD family Fe-S cluster assembly protein [Candidatus Woesearchaeota archaeon]